MTDAALNLTIDNSVAGQLKLSWSATPDENLLGWRVTKQNPDGSWSVAATLMDPAVRTYTITGLAAGVVNVHLWAIVKANAVASSGTVTSAPAPEPTPTPTPVPAGAHVPKVPAGIPGTWTNVFADAFGVPFGTAAGQNNCWFPNNNGTNPFATTKGDNSNELQAYNGSQVSQDAEGARLRLAYEPNAGGSGKNYMGGVINSSVPTPAGYNLFKWKPTAGQSFVLEINWKLPPNTGEMDPAFWSLDSHWTAELDHPECWGWHSTQDPTYQYGCPVWIYKTPSSSVRQESGWGKNPLGFDPTQAFHRWSTVYNADGSLDFYTDGNHRWHCEKPPAEPNRPWMGMVVQNALRTATGSSTSPGFLSGFRDLQVRWVAVYSDTAHAGQNVQGAGVAPGTSLV